MRKGFSPADAAGIHEVIGVMEKALQNFDPCCRSTCEAAELFLASVNPCLLSEAQIERLEHIYRSTISLHELIYVSPKQHIVETSQVWGISSWPIALSSADFDTCLDIPFDESIPCCDKATDDLCVRSDF